MQAKSKQFFCTLIICALIITIPVNLFKGNYRFQMDDSIIEKNNILTDQPVLIPRSSSENAEWTFMVYLDADNNLESAGINDLNEMESVGSSDRINIVVQFDRHPDYDDSNLDWNGTKRGLVTRDTSFSTIGTYLEDIGEQNMGSGTVLQEFISWAQTEYPAENYILVLWDHGSGAMAGPYEGGICWDDTGTYDYLTESEILTAITGKNIDVLGMDACLMASTEFWYGLREQTEYLVGSTKTEPGDGWPYDTILGWLISNPTAVPSQLSEVIAQKYLEFYQPLEAWFGPVTQSAANSSELEALVGAVADLAIAMSAQIGSYKNSIQTIRADVLEYDDEPYIDLYDFADRVGIIPELTDEADLVKEKVNDAVIENQFSSSLSGSHGLSIYFPEASTEFSNYYRQNSFSEDSTWDEFLLNLYSAPIDDDQFEENDGFEEAASITAGYYPGLICDDDDFYNISVNEGELISATITFSHETFVSDLDLNLYAENGSTLDISWGLDDSETVSWIADTSQIVTLNISNFEGTGAMVSYSLYIYIPIGDDIYEENDYFTYDCNINSLINNTITDLTANDEDYYFFNASDDALVTVELEFSAANGILTLELWTEDADYYYLMESVGTASDNAFYQFGTSEEIWTGYYAVVINYENNTNYNLTVSIDYNADDIFDLTGNGNDYINYDPGLISEGYYTDLVCIDYDYYNISLTEGEWLNVTAHFSNDEGDLDIYLYDMNWDKVSYSTYWEDDETIIYYCNLTGIYSILVYPYTSNLNYSLSINTSQTFVDDEFDITNDYLEQNGSFPLLLQDTWYNNLSAWDEDWYAVDLEAGDDLIFTLWFEDNLGTLVLMLYNMSGDLIDYSFTYSPDEFLRFQVEETGRYFIRILPLQRLTGYDLYITAYEPEVEAEFTSDLIDSLTVSFTENTDEFELFGSYYWDFGDGTDYNGLAGNQTHVYESAGQYTVTLYIMTPYGWSEFVSHVVVVYATPTPFQIMLDGTSPMNSSSFVIYWDYIENAQNITLYILNSSITDIDDLDGIEPLDFDPEGTSTSVGISVGINGTYYVVITYENLLGSAMSNVLEVIVALPEEPEEPGDTNDPPAIPGFNLIWLLIAAGASVLLINRKIRKLSFS